MKYSSLRPSADDDGKYTKNICLLKLLKLIIISQPSITETAFYSLLSNSSYKERRINMSYPSFSQVTADILKQTEIAELHNKIDADLFHKYEVKQGLRDKDGTGVVTGLTNVSDVVSFKNIDGVKTPVEGELYYRGYNVTEIVNNCIAENRFGFEEICYLLLFGELPTSERCEWMHKSLNTYRQLPSSFVRDITMKMPGQNIMVALARGVLSLYSYDDNAEDISLSNILRQSIELIAVFPMMAIYSYQAYCYYHKNELFFIRPPKPELSTAENILQMLRPDGSFTALEAQVLDVSLILHAEHGGGNNSTFTTRVVTTAGTDTYSAIAAGLASLKGPKHGGANIKVVEMFEDMKRTVKDWESDEEVTAYLEALLDKKAFDKKGLIYGMGHAVYSLSDPRAEIFKRFVEELSGSKGREDEYKLYSKVAKLAPQIIGHRRKIYKGVSANIDFYSGFVYDMLDLPTELYTPLFAIARIVGWSAHRMEELESAGKIIRPAYKPITEHKDYVEFSKR